MEHYEIFMSATSFAGVCIGSQSVCTICCHVWTRQARIDAEVEEYIKSG